MEGENSRFMEKIAYVYLGQYLLNVFDSYN